MDRARIGINFQNGDGVCALSHNALCISTIECGRDHAEIHFPVPKVRRKIQLATHTLTLTFAARVGDFVGLWTVAPR